MEQSVTWSKDWILNYESSWSILKKFCYINSITYRDLYNEYGIDKFRRKNKMLADSQTSAFSLLNLDEVRIWQVIKQPLHVQEKNSLIKLKAPFNPGSHLSNISIVHELRYCPICFKHKFHSTLTQFLFIRKCPFHNVEILDRCPSCFTKYHFTINDSKFLINYSCHCGFIFSDDNRTLSSKSFTPIIRDRNIERWLNLNETEIQHFQNSLIFNEDYVIRDSKDNMQYDLNFLLSTLNKENKLFRLNSISHILEKNIVKGRINKHPSLHSIYSYINKYQKEELEKTFIITNNLFQSIARKYRKTLLKEHIGCIKELTRKGEGINNDNLCPMAAAYCYWRKNSQGFRSYIDVDNWGTAPYRRFRVSENGYPVIHHNFSTWLYLMENEEIVLPSELTTSLISHNWCINHIVAELIVANFFRYIEYFKNKQLNGDNYNIEDIPVFKYMPLLLLNKQKDALTIYKKEKSNKLNLLHNIHCPNKNKRYKERFKNYRRKNPLLEAIEQIELLNLNKD